MTKAIDKTQCICSDITIIGGGPAGLILAFCCLLEGYTVSVLEKNPQSVWYQNYCFWNEELQNLQIPDTLRALLTQSIERSWDNALVQIDHQTQLRIDSVFSKFDTAKLQRLLLQEIGFLGGHIYEDTAQRIVHHNTHSIVSGAQHYQSRLVFVSNGAGGGLLSYKSATKPAFQIAYGQLLSIPEQDVIDAQLQLNTAGFMDFRPPNTDPQLQYPPSFLYTLPISKTQIFLEETILATREDIDWELLKNRLQQRKEKLKFASAAVMEEEYCRIQMGGGLPERGRTLAFGAAAGFTHPVTGFQILRSVHTAPRVVQQLKMHWQKELETLSSLAWDAIWTERERNNRSLYLLGLDMITGFTLQETQAFFTAFFAVSDSERAAFLSGWGSTRAVEASMWQTFQHASWNTRRLIVQQAIQHPQLLFSALLHKSSRRAS